MVIFSCMLLVVVVFSAGSYSVLMTYVGMIRCGWLVQLTDGDYTGK